MLFLQTSHPGKMCNRCLADNNRDFKVGPDEPLFLTEFNQYFNR